MKATTVFQLILAAGALNSARAQEPTPSVTIQAESPALEQEASKLLKDVRSTAVTLTREAAILDSYGRSDISRSGHSIRITLVREHINTIGKTLDRLQEIRGDVAPWQQQAIDYVVPVAADLAAHTEAAILHLNQPFKPLWDMSYTAHLRAIYDRSSAVKETVDVHLDMAEAGERLEKVRSLTGEIDS